jgi:hypothetical protein
MADIAEQLNNIQSSLVKAKTEKLDNLKPAKGKHGGKRAGAGQPPKDEKVIARGIKEWKNNYFGGEHTMVVTDPVTKKQMVITKPRFVWLYEQAFARAVNSGDLAYIKELLDRNEGRAAQPIRGDGEDDAPIKLNIENIDELLKKAYGD